VGLFDIFSRKPTSTKIEKAAKRMLNEHQQQQIRQEALQELVDFGSPEAISALIRRLGVNFRDTIKNEQEKRWVSSKLVQHFGEQAIEPLIGFIKTDQTISAAIRVLAKLISDERLVGLLIDSLQQYPPEDHRTISARMQLIDALADLHDDRIVPAVTPYTMDHDDDIRIKVIGLLQERVGAEHSEYTMVSEKLFDVLTDAEASGRITRRAAQAMHVLKVDLSAQAKLVEAFLPDGYDFDGTHLSPE
jgi:HEAT repeat protein